MSGRKPSAASRFLGRPLRNSWKRQRRNVSNGPERIASGAGARKGLYENCFDRTGGFDRGDRDSGGSRRAPAKTASRDARGSVSRATGGDLGGDNQLPGIPGVALERQERRAGREQE